MQNLKGKCGLVSLVAGIIFLSAPMMVYGQAKTAPTKSLAMAQGAKTTDATSQDNAKMKQDSEELVNKAMAYIKAKGKEAAFKEFNKSNSDFVKGNLYVFAMGYNGVRLANPNMLETVGKNIMNDQDADGVYFAKNLIAKAKSGGGWVNYRHKNPTTKQTDCKNSYVMPASKDYLIGAGYYFPENSVTHKCDVQ
jgi:signal transduction histidine kinase